MPGAVSLQRCDVPVGNTGTTEATGGAPGATAVGLSQRCQSCFGQRALVPSTSRPDLRREPYHTSFCTYAIGSAVTSAFTAWFEPSHERLGTSRGPKESLCVWMAQRVAYHYVVDTRYFKAKILHRTKAYGGAKKKT